MDPSTKREQDERRLTGLKVGAVALTVAGLGAFAGLAAAGTDDPSTSPGTAPANSVTPSSSASDAARAAEDDPFFDDQAQGGAVGGYADGGYDYDGDGYGHDDGDEHHGPPSGGYGGYGDPGGYGDQGGASGTGGAGAGWGSSQGSTGGS